MKSLFNKKIILLFSIILLGMVVSVIISEKNKLVIKKSNKLVEHTHEVFKKSARLESLIQYVIFDSRAYIISGDSIFIDQSKIASKEIKKELEDLSLLISDNHKQVVRVESLKKLFGDQLEFLSRANELQRKEVFSAAQNLVILHNTKYYIDGVKKVVGAIQREEARLLKIGEEAYLKSNVAFYRSFYFLLSSIAALLVIMFFILRHNLKVKKKVEDALFIKNEWYNQTMASLGWGVITVDLNGVVTFINRVASELSGLKQEKCVGDLIEDVFEIRDGKNGKQVLKPLMKAIRKNEVLLLDNNCVLKRNDDSRIFVDVSGAPIHNQRNEIIGGVLIFKDVSENKKLELALLNSLKEINDYKYALDESSIVAITNQKGVITYVNDNFCQISKYSREELIGQDHRIVKSGSHSKEFIRELWTTIGKGKIWKGEIENRKKDGSLYWVDTTVVPFLNDKGKPYQYIAIRSDITERKQFEEDFSTLANNISQLAWMADADGMVFWYNQRWFDYSGTTIADMKGWGWKKIHHPDHLQRVVTKIKDCFQSGEAWEDSFPLLGNDGLYRWFLSRAVPIRDANGAVIRWFGTNTDTTELKGAEEKLVEYQQELEAKVEERTKDLLEKEQSLETQNQELHKTNSELDRFVYSTSHDLRAPLKSMLGLIAIVKESEEPRNIDQIKRLDMLNKSVVRLDAFIEDILSYSRNARMDVINEELNFRELIEEIRSNHKFMEGANEIKPKVEINQKATFNSDKRRVSVILNNLISNAIKYKDVSKEESFVTVFVECDSEKAIVTIEDNGIGIAEDKQGRVFEMFYRATKLSTGSGLGMYIVKETLEKLGGTITLKSKENKGSKFIIQLPNQNK